MKKPIVAVIIGLLAVVCIAQQVWILGLYRAAAAMQAAAAAPPIPPIAYELGLLSESLKNPAGAKSIRADDETPRLSCIGFGDLGLEGYLWLDISEIAFKGYQMDLRERRVAAVAAFYASQVATLIPDAYVEGGISPHMAPRGCLHSTFLVKHPAGDVVVSAGYMATFEAEQQLRDAIFVHVISSNDGVRGRSRGVGVGRLLPPG